MTGNNASKRALSIGLFVAGVALMIVSLVMDFMGTGFAGRGPMLLVGALCILAGLYFFPTGKHRGIINFIFLFPLLFCFFITVILPFALGLFYSFTDWNGIKYTEFVGLSNYLTMFTSIDFTYSICLTFIFVIFNMILVNVVGFCLALLCTSKLKGVGFFRAAFFLPNLIGGIVLGYVWQFIFQALMTVLKANASMLADYKTAFIAIVMVYVWQYAGYIMLIYVTGLTTIPGDVLEAASIDGANSIQTLFKIKIPMIASTFTICTFLTLTSAFKQFDVNMALTGGSPMAMIAGKTFSNGTQMLALDIYKTAIANNHYALGQAKAVLFFVILACVSLIQVRVSNSKEVEM